MKRIWVLVACAFCFVAGCNVGEEMLRARIRKALREAGNALSTSAASAESETLWQEIKPTPLPSAPDPDMRRMLLRKDAELRVAEEAAKSNKTNAAPKR